MIISIENNGQTFKFDESKPLNIAIPLNFNGKQPNAYGVEIAISKAYKAGEIVGDTRRGGSVNFEQITFIPHCNGTHTECVGHITHERISVNDCLQDAFMLAQVISIEPENAQESEETYAVELNESDKLITRNAIEKALNNFKFQIANFRLEENLKSQISNFKSLIIRTLPNDESKFSRTYLQNIPPFFTTEAMEYISELNIKHLLVDMPSIDRIFDEGKLSNHRIFWNIEQESFEISVESFINRTITELIYVSNEIADGDYLLNLQIAPFQSDAAPSRPILFKLISERSA